MKKYFLLFRCKHYIKNVLIFFPLFFSGNLSNSTLVVDSFYGFFIFCAVSSIIYIINDIQDAERDRMHPRKRNRPIASGQVTPKKAIFLTLLLASFCIAIWYWKHFSIQALICCMLYFILNVIYSLGGKNTPILDLIILASGFPIRVLFGGFITGIEVSSWLFLTILCISLYLGLGKRRGELLQIQKSGNKHTLSRPVLENYSLTYLTSEMYLYLGLGLVFYSLWTLEKSDTLVYTIPLVIMICMKYNLVISDTSDGDPIETIFSNKTFLISGVVYILLMFVLIYF